MKVRPAAAATVIALVLAGCTPWAQPDTPPTPARLWDEVTTSPAWVLDGYTPVSAPEATDDGFVLYALNQDDELEAIGVAAATGEVRWHYPANHSLIITGVGLSIEVGFGLAVFLAMDSRENAEQGWVKVSGVDATTGEQRFLHHNYMRVGTHPRLCNDESQFCLMARYDQQTRWVVLNRGLSAVAEVPTDDTRLISDGLVPANDATELVRLAAGGELWRRPVRELFGGADVSPDQGWNIERGGGRYVGTLSGASWVEGPEEVYRFDLTGTAMAAFDEATGDPIWAEPATRTCASSHFTLEHPLRCRWTGQAVSEAGEVRLEGEVTVEGFDPATGAATWSWDAGAVLGMFLHDESVRQVDDTIYLVTTESGVVVLDVATGERQPAPDPSPPGWCSERVSHEPAIKVSYLDFNDLYVTEWWPCDAEGERVDLPVTTPEFAGATAGDVFAYVVDGHLRAVTITGAAPDNGATG